MQKSSSRGRFTSHGSETSLEALERAVWVAAGIINSSNRLIIRRREEEEEEAARFNTTLNRTVCTPGVEDDQCGDKASCKPI